METEWQWWCLSPDNGIRNLKEISLESWAISEVQEEGEEESVRGLQKTYPAPTPLPNTVQSIFFLAPSWQRG